jgi:hypothetical protein
MKPSWALLVKILLPIPFSWLIYPDMSEKFSKFCLPRNQEIITNIEK